MKEFKETFTSLDDIGLGEQAGAVPDILWKFDSPFIYDVLGLYIPKGVAADMESRYGESHRKMVLRVISKSYGWRRLIEDYDKAKRKNSN